MNNGKLKLAKNVKYYIKKIVSSFLEYKKLDNLVSYRFDWKLIC